MKNKEKVNNPAHYGGAENPHEVYKCLEAWGLVRSAYAWNAVKYLSRAGKKEGESALDDLKKARWYLEREVQRVMLMTLMEEAGHPRKRQKKISRSRSEGTKRGWETRRKNSRKAAK